MDVWCNEYMLRDPNNAMQWLDGLTGRLRTRLNGRPAPCQWDVQNAPADQKDRVRECVIMMIIKHLQDMCGPNRRDFYFVMLQTTVWMLDQYFSQGQSMKHKRLSVLIAAICLVVYKFEVGVKPIGVMVPDVPMAAELECLACMPSPKMMPDRTDVINSVTALTACRILYELTRANGEIADSVAAILQENDFLTDLLEWLEAGADRLVWKNPPATAIAQLRAMLEYGRTVGVIVI